SKVDRSAAYMGRYVAKNIVAAGLASSAEIQFAYAIGFPDPVSVCINTFGTGVVPDEQIERAVCEVFSFKPASADLFEDHQLRPFREERSRHLVGKGGQDRRAEKSHRKVGGGGRSGHT